MTAPASRLDYPASEAGELYRARRCRFIRRASGLSGDDAAYDFRIVTITSNAALAAKPAEKSSASAGESGTKPGD